MAKEPSTVDRIESAANITLTISRGGSNETAINTTEPGQSTADNEAAADILEIPISRLDRTKDVEISEIRESSLKASGYSVTSISFSGSMMFKGERVSGPDSNPTYIEDLLFDNDGVPNPVSITITHEISGDAETFQDVLVTSDSYEVQSESETETAFDWIAMDKNVERTPGEPQ